MNLRPILPPVLFLGAMVALVYMGWVREREVPLVPVTEGPRPPVTADPGTRPIVERGLLDRFVVRGNALREERNEMARKHAEAVELWRQGKRPLREVESLEQMLWVARWRVGEIPERVLHERLAELFAREAERMALLRAQGLAGEDELECARLFVARERLRAGLPAEEPWGDYAERRKAYLEAWRRRKDLLLESGIGTHENVEIDWRTLQQEFPGIPSPATRG